MRLVWDGVLLIVNSIMVALSKMPVQTFFLNGFILFIVDGYLNLAIYSYLLRLKILEREKGKNLQIDQIN